MSRVHDALRRSELAGTLVPGSGGPQQEARVAVAASTAQPTMEGLLELVQSIPYNPSPEALVIDPLHPHEAPTEEFRTLRTRLNHMQSLQPIHTAVVTSPSPGEGKSFAATNLALAEAQLSGNLTLLCDFDLRRPVVHSLLQTDRGPGISPDEIERIFEKFYRGRHGRGKTEGTGMGLAIAKGIIEAHGGKIHAEDRPGGGALISFSLPAHPITS